MPGPFDRRKHFTLRELQALFTCRRRPRCRIKWGRLGVYIDAVLVKRPPILTVLPAGRGYGPARRTAVPAEKDGEAFLAARVITGCGRTDTMRIDRAAGNRL
jgi:hypothetical protein